MKSPPPPLIPSKRSLDLYPSDSALERPQKRLELHATFDPNYLSLRDTDIDMMVPVDPNAGVSNLLPGPVGSQNTGIQVVSASVDVPELEQRTPDNQGVPETEVNKYLRRIAC